MADVSVWVRTEFVGVHHWPDAPAERAYLASAHRHRFEVTVEVGVDKLDRQVEFHDLLGDVRSELELWRGGHDIADMGSLSCEQMATALADAILSHYGCDVAVTVSEDGECGARVSLP
jgi:hypothetical protein